MKKITILVSFFIAITSSVLTAAPLLTKVEKLPISSSVLPGYDFDTDQAFKINSGPLSEDVIFFAMKILGGDQNVIPRFVLANKNSIVDSIELPTVDSGSNIVAVQAVTVELPKNKKLALRVLAILTLEPYSGRSSDYWDQSFVFDISTDGKIEANADLNSKLSKLQKKKLTIKSVKDFLKKQNL